MVKWKIGAIIGIIWSMVSICVCVIFPVGVTNSLIFIILTLPASVPILLAIPREISPALFIYVIPILGILIGGSIGYLIDKFNY